MRAELRGTFGGTLQGDPRLCRQRIGFGAVGALLVRGEVVSGQGAGELVVAEPSK